MAIAIDATLPQPKAVAITRPRTSPIAQPVRQCQVAANAERLSDGAAAEWSCAWSMPMCPLVALAFWVLAASRGVGCVLNSSRNPRRASSHEPPSRRRANERRCGVCPLEAADVIEQQTRKQRD